MPQYVLARHVFVCVQGEHVVFLDVRKDRYFALESARTAGLEHFVPGWPVPAPIGVDLARHDAGCTAAVLSEQLNRSALSAVIALLLEKEILLAEPADGKSAAVTIAAPLHAELAADGLDERPRFGPRLLAQFVSSTIRARLLLKHRTFESVIDRVRSRAERERARALIFPQERLQGLISSFATLRPFFFAVKDACLFDALSLSEFLAGYCVYPNWVFGVQSRPFAAHCWLQLDGVVLNDTIDHVKRYTPIMVV